MSPVCQNLAVVTKGTGTAIEKARSIGCKIRDITCMKPCSIDCCLMKQCDDDIVETMISMETMTGSLVIQTWVLDLLFLEK